MAALTAIAIAGLAVSAVGIGLNIYGQSQQSDAQQRAETARNKQMQLDASRQRRDVIRNSLAGQFLSMFNASNQGAQGGSGVAGGYGQIMGRAGGQYLGINQNESIGGDLFAANQAYYQASGITSFGSGLVSLGNAAVENAGVINRVGTYFTGGRPPSSGSLKTSGTGFSGGIV